MKTTAAILLLAVVAAAQTIDPGTDGVLPKITVQQPIAGEWAPMDVEFDIVATDNVEWLHTQLSGVVDVFIGQNEDVFAFIGGRLMAAGGLSLLDQFYDGSQNAITGDCAAGTKGCWAIPLGSGVTTTLKVQVIGHGATLSAAVEAYKAKIAALKAAGWVPKPSTACD